MTKSWRHVITPRKEVREGRYTESKFVVNLADILKGIAEPEYQNPDLFFRYSILTNGMKSVIKSALRRISGTGGDPVAALKTLFGGGKSHTEAALLHIFKSPDVVESHGQVIPFLKEIGFEKIPRANIAVLVGVDHDVTKPISVSGLKINTLWGYAAYQIGKEKAYDMVKVADLKSVAPGKDTFTEMLNMFGPCLIIMDELIPYAKNIYKKTEQDHLPSGTFDSLMTFLQNLTEAVRGSKDSMLIITMPESDIEIGGEGGKAALDHIEKIIGRVHSIWSPVDANESFEIIKRKLFEPLNSENEKDIDDTCRAFGELYGKNPNIFPRECREPLYVERLKKTYPFHSEILDRLYTDWSTLPKFQRTRGTLRLGSTVVHQLWISEDKSLMIKPGDIPLFSPKVRDELTDKLSDKEGWDSIVDNDVDGERSEPKKIDGDDGRLGQFSAARKVARTIFLGSAPSSREQRNKGIDTTKILLGVAEPEDNLGAYDDAIGRLSERLAYIYNYGNRYWYDSHPNLNRIIADKAAGLHQETVNEEIKSRLSSKRKGEFAGIHIWTESEEIPDDDKIRLVVLSPDYQYEKNDNSCKANVMLRHILESRGHLQRRCQNMLIFLATDQETFAMLDKDVRNYLAWKSVFDEQERLNLDAFQRRQVQESKEGSDFLVSSKIDETYCWLLVPTQMGSDPMDIISVRVKSGEKGSFISKAYRHAVNDGCIVPKLDPEGLNTILDNDTYRMWNDSGRIDTKKLWEYCYQYVYMPRLKDMSVIIDCIKEGVKRKYFGYSSDMGLVFGNQNVDVTIDSRSFIVKKDVVQSQHVGRIDKPGYKGVPSIGIDIHTTVPIESSVKTKFDGIIDLDGAASKISDDLKKICDEVIQHLKESDIKITLIISADMQSGVSGDKERILRENCAMLNFKNIRIE